MGSCISSSATPAFKPSSASTANTSALVTLLGDKLLSKSGKVQTSDALAGKSMIGIYFSAHWCPPCRGFTPVLSKAYADLKAKYDFEIVFVSSDSDASSFRSYFAEMPWLSVPFEDRKVKAQLSEKFGVQGIPKLVLLNGDGTLVTTDGRAKIMNDPTGQTWMPAAPAPVKAPSVPASAHKATGLGGLLGETFLATDGKTKVALDEVVKDKPPLIGLYFSAHWCGPCRAFTPKLVTFVEMLKEEEGVDLPIIFGSSDRDEAGFQEYFASMPWLAFPHGDARIDALKAKYEVSGIPWLVILDADGNLVVNEADEDVPNGPQAYKKWLAMAKPAKAAAPAA